MMTTTKERPRTTKERPRTQIKERRTTYTVLVKRQERTSEHTIYETGHQAMPGFATPSTNRTATSLTTRPHQQCRCTNSIRFIN